MAHDEERLLEEELEVQLQEQRDSLAAIEEALAADSTNTELIHVCEELVQAIRDAEQGLLQLKRARLLREADSVLRDTNSVDDVKVEPLDPAEVEPEPIEDKGYSVGTKCRFRHTNGRWYNGLVVAMVGSGSAKVCFLTPTSENMLMCKFFLQQRCRFGSNCRLSHGFDVPLSSLKKYIPTVWEQSKVGSTILAISDNSRTGLWREAELASWDDKLGKGSIVFQDDGTSSVLGSEAISLSEYAEMSDDEEDNDRTPEQSESSDYDEEDNSPQGLGFLESSTSQKGIQTETAIFAKWENHTRGIASKMMANMGYREGMGLGVSGQGILDPVSVKVLPPKQSLDHALASHKREQSKEGQEKKRSRGGKRKRDKKFAAAAKAAKEREDPSPDMFSLINSQLALHNEAVNGRSEEKQAKKGFGKEQREDRHALVAYDHEVKELKLRVEKLEEMANRNRKEKAVYEAATRKLIETRRALAEAEAAHASASNAVASKDKEKRWLKF